MSGEHDHIFPGGQHIQRDLGRLTDSLVRYQQRTGFGPSSSGQSSRPSYEQSRTPSLESRLSTAEAEIRKLKSQLAQETQRANAAERRASDAERRAADAERRLRELTGGSSTTYRSTTPSSAPSYVPQPASAPNLDTRLNTPYDPRRISVNLPPRKPLEEDLAEEDIRWRQYREQNPDEQIPSIPFYRYVQRTCPSVSDPRTLIYENPRLYEALSNDWRKLARREKLSGVQEWF